LAFSIKK